MSISPPPAIDDPSFDRWLFGFYKSVGATVVTSSPIGNVTVSQGGTGATSLTGYVKGNGANPFSAVSQIPYTDISGAPNNRTYGPNIDSLDNTATTGIYSITGVGVSAVRTMTGTASRLTITNGDGVAGNPTFDISTSYVGQATITTLGTITTGIWNAGAVTSSGAGAFSGAITSTSTVSCTAGTGTGTPVLIGAINVNTTTVGNVGAALTDLMTYTLPANSLSANGKGVRVTAWGTIVNNANAKTLTVNFGSTVMATDALTTGGALNWKVIAHVFRTGNSTQTYIAEISSSANGLGVRDFDIESGTSAQTDTATIIIKCTAQGTSNNDITQTGMLVEFFN